MPATGMSGRGLPMRATRASAAPRAASEVAQLADAAAPTATAAVQAAVAAPFATISRVLLNSQPTSMLRSLTNKSMPRVSGPITLLLFLVTLAGIVMGMVRYALVRKVKTCSSCRGFGIQRCRLCDGEGNVMWAAKMKYASSCPLCMNKRHVTCTECGGYFNRPLFSHMRRKVQKDGSVTEEPQGMGGRLVPAGMPVEVQPPRVSRD